jgi:hypothetical protein
MAGEALATMACDSCGNPAALVKKTGNSRLLYLHCKCGVQRSSGQIFQQKLQNAISGISEQVSEIVSENIPKNSEDWRPDITTQSAPLAGISEINKPEPEQAPTVPKGKTAKKIAGFGLFALALLGMAIKVAK